MSVWGYNAVSDEAADLAYEEWKDRDSDDYEDDDEPMAAAGDGDAANEQPRGERRAR